MTAIELISKERAEQLNKHKRTIEKDVEENPSEEIKEGAVAILLQDWEQFPGTWNNDLCAKMMNKPYKGRLIIAAALLAAEIDRLIYVEDMERNSPQFNG